MKIVNSLGHLTFLSWVLVQFVGARQPSYPQISPSRSRKGSSCRGLHVGLSLEQRTDILPCAFSTTISTLKVPAIEDRQLSSSFIGSVKIRSPSPSRLPLHRDSERRYQISEWVAERR